MLLLLQSDTGDKLAGADLQALQINCCIRAENWSCISGGNSTMLSEVFIDVLVDGSRRLLLCNYHVHYAYMVLYIIINNNNNNNYVS